MNYTYTCSANCGLQRKKQFIRRKHYIIATIKEIEQNLMSCALRKTDGWI